MKLNNMVEWFKELFNIVKQRKNREREFIYLTKKNDEFKLRLDVIHNEFLFQRDKVLDAVNTIKERTNIHADISHNVFDANQIIVVGRYNKHDYVQVFNVKENDLRRTIDMLREMQEYGRLKTLDASPMSVSFLRDEITRP